ncbi:MAG: hypothetical protein EP301_00415 [Gammaproteobacteria bacterium]|nr:MAG: hypothetical protein EP301_00415 [Gammaproteobacteria bacterium]
MGITDSASERHIVSVLTGCGRDMRGEVGCLSFTLARTWNTGLGYLVYRAVRGARWRSEVSRVARQAFWRGRRSR